jgi:hypothetical protein
MTYQDPRNPDPGLGRDPPRYEDRDAYNMGPGAIISMALAAAVMIGVLAFTMNKTSTTASTPPPTTSGQGGTQTIPPGAPPNETAPNP